MVQAHGCCRLLSCTSGDLALFGEKKRRKRNVTNFTESYDHYAGQGMPLALGLAAEPVRLQGSLLTINIECWPFMPCPLIQEGC